jgi:hypothetical protein
MSCRVLPRTERLAERRQVVGKERSDASLPLSGANHPRVERQYPLARVGQLSAAEAPGGSIWVLARELGGNFVLDDGTPMAYRGEVNPPWMTVFETAHYLSRAADLFSEQGQADIVTMVARDPACGAVIPGSGGIRKVRVAVAGRGKRGGARLIYFYHNAGMPVFLLTVFAKNERADLSPRERADLSKLADALVRAYAE